MKKPRRLTAEQRNDIRSSPLPVEILAEKYHVCVDYVHRLRQTPPSRRDVQAIATKRAKLPQRHYEVRWDG